MTEWTVDCLAVPEEFPHYWESCVGSCHAVLGLRQDWREQLKTCHDELGMRYVRFHGLFDDDMSVCTNLWGKVSCSFFNIDSLFDYILSIGMRPFVELGFMPEALASGGKTVFHYKGNVTPPKDYAQWGGFIACFARHLVDRYGIGEVREWFFEVWNEPNLECFWAGSRDEYFRLYATTAKALKAVDGGLRVGGPATAENQWLLEMRRFCEQGSIPLDFLTTHHYPTDTALGHGGDMEKAMASVHRGILTEALIKAVEEAGPYPLYYTEWNSNPSCLDPYHDEPYEAAFILKTLADNAGLTDVYSFWAFSDLFEEVRMPSEPFHGGFGLLNIHGVAKPSYRVFQMLHKAGTLRVPCAPDRVSTVEVLAVRSPESWQIFIYNHQLPLHPIRDEAVRIVLKGCGQISDGTIEHIDDRHANAKAEWIAMGKPEYPSEEQIARLREKSRVAVCPCKGKTDGENWETEMVVPAHGIALITLKMAM